MTIATQRVLVVDDEPSITLAVCSVVKSLGLDAVAYNDPREAMNETRFDLIITDFNMPHVSGIELLRHLRVTHPDAVRLMVTAVNDFKVAMKAVNEGEIFKLLPKPWTLNELRSAILEAIEYHRVIQENRRLTRELEQRNKELLSLNSTLEQQITERTSGLLEGMIRALDFRDTETQWHSWRVSRFTSRLAVELGISGDALVHIEQGALLHDIGKIGVRDAILLKPGPLTPEEWVDMRKHPEIGYRMLERIPYLRPAAEIVYQHQEKWNGGGYPRGLKGEEITIGARIFCVADTLDAICSDRPYRKGSPMEVALHEISRLASTQFDPRAVEAFMGIPSSEWDRIRKEIEVLEQADKSRRAPR